MMYKAQWMAGISNSMFSEPFFYRFISENFASYIEGGDDSINYAALSDEIITPEIKNDAVKTKGYFIYPSQLFANIAAGANNNVLTDKHIEQIMQAFDSKEKIEHGAFWKNRKTVAG